MEGEGRNVGAILIVDDNPGDIRLIEAAIEESGLNPTVHTTSTRDEAIEFLTDCRDQPDTPEPVLVLLDWHLSRATGEGVLEAATSGERRIPVIVMTGSNSDSAVLDIPTETAERVIEKPTDPDEYVEHLRSGLPNC